jgi:hypothetical protein
VTAHPDHTCARADRLADQVATIPGLMQRIGVLEAELRRAAEDIHDLTRERNQIRQERDRWRAAYPDLPPQRIQGVTT